MNLTFLPPKNVIHNLSPLFLLYFVLHVVDIVSYVSQSVPMFIKILIPSHLLDYIHSKCGNYCILFIQKWIKNLHIYANSHWFEKLVMEWTTKWHMTKKKWQVCYFAFTFQDRSFDVSFCPSLTVHYLFITVSQIQSRI